MKIGDNVKIGLSIAFVLLIIMVAGVALFMKGCGA